MADEKGLNFLEEIIENDCNYPTRSFIMNQIEKIKVTETNAEIQVFTMNLPEIASEVSIASWGDDPCRCSPYSPYYT